jgi:hypothetical protein
VERAPSGYSSGHDDVSDREVTVRLKLSHAPVRLATGLFILNSGLTKLRIDDEETQKHIHGMAADAYPQFQSIQPGTFTKALGAGEVALGGALLVPVVGPVVAGAGLVGFSSGLLGLYWRLPGMRQPGSVLPSQDGTPLAKDVWMLGIGVGLVLDGISSRVRRVVKRV